MDSIGMLVLKVKGSAVVILVLFCLHCLDDLIVSGTHVGEIWNEQAR